MQLLKLITITSLLYCSAVQGMEERKHTIASRQASSAGSAASRGESKSTAASTAAQSASKQSAPKAKFATTLDAALMGKLDTKTVHELIGAYTQQEIDPYNFFPATFICTTARILPAKAEDIHPITVTAGGKAIVRYTTIDDLDAVSIWSAQGKLLHTINDHINTRADEQAIPQCSPAGIAAINYTGSIVLYDLDGKVIQRLPNSNIAVLKKIVAPPESLYIFGYNHNTLYLWEKSKSDTKLIHTLEMPQIMEAVISTDQKYLVVMAINQISFFSLSAPEAQSKVITLPGDNRFLCLAALSNGRIATGSEQSSYLWDPATGIGMPIPMRSVSALAAGASNTLIAADYNGTIDVWDIANKKTLHTLRGYTEPITQLLIAPKNQLISCSENGPLHIWDLATGNNLAIIPHADHVAISPDGKTLYTAIKNVIATYQLATAAVEELQYADDKQLEQLLILIKKIRYQAEKLIRAHSNAPMALSAEYTALLVDMPAVRACLQSNFNLKL